MPDSNNEQNISLVLPLFPTPAFWVKWCIYPLENAKRNKCEIYKSNQFPEFSFSDVMIDILLVFFKVWLLIVSILVHFILLNIRHGNTALLILDISFTQKIYLHWGKKYTNPDSN